MGLVAEDPFEISAHRLDGEPVLVVVDMDAAGILLEDHLGNEQFFGIGSFVDVLAFHQEDILLVDGLAETLQKLGLEFLIFYVQSVAGKVEFPYLLDLEVFAHVLPVGVDLFDQLEVRFHYPRHCAQVH